MKQFLARIERGRPRAAIHAKLWNLNNNSKNNKILLRSGNVFTNFSTRKRCFGTTRDKFNDDNNVKSIPPPSRGHRRRRQELTNETNHLLDVLKNRPHERSMITSHYCYGLLKGWADLAKDSKSVDDAHQAKALMEALCHTNSSASSSSSSSSVIIEPTILFYDLVLEALASCHNNNHNSNTNDSNNDDGTSQQTAHDYLLQDIPKELLHTKSFNIAIHAGLAS